MSHSNWQERLHDKMREQAVTRWTTEHQVMYYPPKPVHIAVRRALHIAVFAFVRYPMPNGKHETTYERIV